jgi:IclR family transcriptional regulator, KDG regulon repressor
MKKHPVKSPMRSQFKSLLRAIDILDLLGENAALSVTEISDLLAFPRSTTYKYLAVMRECRMVDYDQILEKYKLGMKLFELGTAVQNRIAIDRIAHPYMEELSDLLGETVGLTVVDGNYALYVEKVEPGSSNTMVFLLRKGIRFPLHAGAASKILLAYQREERIEGFLKTQRLVKYTEKTIVDPDKLRKEIRAIRKAGCAFSEEEIDLGVRALAAPIFDHEGKIAAGLVVFGPAQRIDDQKKEKTLKSLLECSRKISKRIGGKMGNLVERELKGRR